MRISDWSSDVCSSDLWGNLVYRKTARNFGPLMAMAAACTIAQVSGVVALGELDPESVVTPGIFVQRLVSNGGEADRKSVVYGKSVSVRVDLGGSRLIKKKTTH